MRRNAAVRLAVLALALAPVAAFGDDSPQVVLAQPGTGGAGATGGGAIERYTIRFNQAMVPLGDPLPVVPLTPLAPVVSAPVRPGVVAPLSTPGEVALPPVAPVALLPAPLPGELRVAALSSVMTGFWPSFLHAASDKAARAAKARWRKGEAKFMSSSLEIAADDRYQQNAPRRVTPESMIVGSCQGSAHRPTCGMPVGAICPFECWARR